MTRNKTAPMTILQALDDKNLFAPHFAKFDATAWRTLLAAAFGLPMTPAELLTFIECTGRTETPTSQAEEVWLACGRRGGKSRVLALVAVYLAAWFDYRPFLSIGELPTIPVIASDKAQAEQIFSYARALMLHTPMLAKMLIKEPTAGTIELKNEVTISVMANSFRSIRGRTVPAVLCDEIAFWYSDGANPDAAVLDALRPAMSTIPNAMMLIASSPHAKRGALYQAYRDHYGKNGDPILFWKASSKTMNPTLRDSVIKRAYERDPDMAKSEYGGDFRSDLSNFVDRDTVIACTDTGVTVRPPVPGQQYMAFVDPSGGSSDSMTMAIAHRELAGEIVTDCLVETRAPFVPATVVAEFVAILRSYGVGACTGDRYAGQWVQTEFEKHGVTYSHSELAKSALYIDLLPRLNTGTVRLLDNSTLTNQLANLERRTARGGKDSVDHPPGARDDLANVVAGVASMFGATAYSKLLERARDPSLEVIPA